MSRSATKRKPPAKMSAPPPKPEPVQRVEQAQAQQAELEREFRIQRCYEQCKFAALGRVLFSDIPQVRGVLLANAMVVAVQQQILIANSRVILPEGVKP